MPDLARLTGNAEKVRELTAMIQERVRNTHFLCLCKHGTYGKPYPTEPGKDDYGFLKQRMWSQYAQNSKGVCLPFSKRKLAKEANEKFRSHFPLAEDMEYKRFHYIDAEVPEVLPRALPQGLSSFDELDNKRFVVKYLHDCRQSLCFRKHLDFQGENEFRIAVIPGEDTLDDPYIDISSSLVGIITNDLTAEPYTEMLCHYKQKFDCYLGMVDWDNVCLTPVVCGKEPL